MPSTKDQKGQAEWPEVFVARFRSLDGCTEHEMVGPRRAAEMGDEAERYLPASTVQGLVGALESFFETPAPTPHYDDATSPRHSTENTTSAPPSTTTRRPTVSDATPIERIESVAAYLEGLEGQQEQTPDLTGCDECKGYGFSFRLGAPRGVQPCSRGHARSYLGDFLIAAAIQRALNYKEAQGG